MRGTIKANILDFTAQQLKQIEYHGLTLKQVENQLQTFKEGIPFINLTDCATIENGILQISDDKKQTYIKLYNSKLDDIEVIKFVPASGAATRMFKSLYRFLDTYYPSKESINAFINKTKDNTLKLFFVGLEKFPFYEAILQQLKKTCPNYNSLSDDDKKVCIVECLLGETGLNYGNLPKGLVPFHKYKEHTASAFAEHLFEASKYAAPNKKAHLHFTISNNHYNKFKSEYDRIKDIVSNKTDTTFITTESYQKKSTDTIAVNLDNTPFVDDDGNLVFRPGGHGALIENLNEQDADIIFIKNIDNVVTYQYEEDVANYKKMLGGLLLEQRQTSFKFLEMLDENANPTEEFIHEIVYFLQDNFNNILSEDFEKFSLKYQIEYLREQLDKPIRVCGMVKNEGEPGGGPFWVKHESGKISLQIVESVQINKEDPRQLRCLNDATHFNPVDIVCSVRNYKGEKFDLLKYVDYKAGFINQKTINGQDIKALERPGLWNGSMAHWNTIFVEVPLSTFNPVKTVVDLLKESHQISN